MKILKGENINDISFLTKNKTTEKIFNSPNLRYINLFAITTMYNNYRKGFLRNYDTANICINELQYIGEAKALEYLAYYQELKTGEKNFLNYEDLRIVIKDDKTQNEEFYKWIRLDKTQEPSYMSFKTSRIRIKGKTLITEEKNIKKRAAFIFETYSITEQEKKIIEKIFEQPTEIREQLILNMMYFSYWFNILSVEDLKNENYLILTYLLKKQIDKPQLKIRNHKNLNLMCDLITWVNTARLKDYKAFITMDLLQVLNDLTEDNFYFLTQYFLNPTKDFNICKYHEKKEIFNEGLKKFMALTSYSYKEQIALNFDKISIVKSFIKGTKRNDLLRKIKLLEKTNEKRKEKMKIKKEEKKEQKTDFIETIKEKELNSKTIIEESKKIHYHHNTDIFAIDLKKETTEGILEKKLKDSWITVAKNQEEVDSSGKKASCCLHSSGILKNLSNWIFKNNQMACLYGTINNKNFQTLAYLKIEVNPYRRTIVLDNIEANLELNAVEYNRILKEIKTIGRGYGVHTGAIRTDVTTIKNELKKHMRKEPNKIKERRNMGLLNENSYFNDYNKYIEERTARAFDIPKNLFVRPATDSDLIQISQIEKETYGEYDTENVYIKEYLKGNEKINVISDEDKNIYGYSVIRIIKTILNISTHIQEPELVLKIETLSNKHIDVKNFIKKEEKEYIYIEDFNIIKELRKSKVIYDLARKTIESIKEYGANKIYYHSNENSKNMQHFLSRKGLEPIDLRNNEKQKKKRIKKVI